MISDWGLQVRAEVIELVVIEVVITEKLGFVAKW